MDYIRKADLYKIIASIRHMWGIDDMAYRTDFIELCQKKGIKIQAIPFITPGLRGMASLGNTYQDDVILLNSARNKIEQNVDCAHEFIHVNFHRNKGYQSFHCFEMAKPSQNKYLEWQANEGGAELIVPYQTLLPKIKKCIHFLRKYNDIILFKEELVHEYGVTDAVITFRLESLKYEIHQYLNGISLNNIQILSYTSQSNNGINIKSLNTLAIENFKQDL